MKCPFIINQKVTQRYKDYQGNEMYFDIEREFRDCYEEECPYFVYEASEPICTKVHKSAKDMKED